MAKTSKNILDEARKEFKQIDIDEARRIARQGRHDLSTCARATNGAKAISRRRSVSRAASSRLRIEEKVPDRKTPVIMQCASGHPLAADASTAMRELGYENVYNLAGGFNAWKDRGLPWEADRQFTPDELTRYSRHFVIPEVGEKGQAKLLDSKVLLLGAGALGSSGRRCTWRRRESVRSGWLISTWSISRTCSARSSIPSIGSGCPRPSRRKSRSPR